MRKKVLSVKVISFMIRKMTVTIALKVIGLVTGAQTRKQASDIIE
jgi:transcriptional regulator of met regulon